MALNKKIEKYIESKEYKDILKKSKIKIENIESQIESLHNEGKINRELNRNEFDVRDNRIKDLEDIASQIKDKNGQELLDYYNSRIKDAKLFLYQPINQYGQSNSILKYTELDMLRFTRSNYYEIGLNVKALLGSEDKEVNIDELGAY